MLKLGYSQIELKQLGAARVTLSDVTRRFPDSDAAKLAAERLRRIAGGRTLTAEVSRLKLTEIFYSLQGEADTAGIPTTFVRLTGCPLRCQYCDTAYAFHGGEWWELDAIVARVRELGTQYVCVTGGEPLAQKTCVELLRRLCDEGFRVSLETSGAMSLEGVDPRVVMVVDVKTPGSGEERRNRYDELTRSTRTTS